MKNNIDNITRMLAIAATVVALGTSASAQVALTTEMNLIVSDKGAGPVPGLDTLRWGFQPTATNGKDAALGEEEQPPTPPEGVFDTRWVNVGSSSDFGQGVKRNYHAYGSASQMDTFRFKVQPAFQPGQDGYPVTITWGDLKPYFTTASIRFVDGDGNPTIQDMLTATSMQITNGASVSSTLTITVSGPKDPASGVDDQENSATALMLVHAPNPVRKEIGTTISYTLPQTADVSLKLYNALGQLVREISAGRQEASRHTFHLDTRGLESGSYYYMLNAGEIIATRSLIIVE
jgi:hypothetical protein